MAQNELALELYKSGIFAPLRAPAALLCLEMMDLDGKEAIMEKIAKNAGMGGDEPADLPSVPSRPASLRGGESEVTASAREAAANVTRVR